MLGWLLSLVAAAAAPPVETLRAVRLESPVTVDGKREAAWDAAPPCADFRLWGDPEAAPKYKTAVRFAYDDHALYVLFECEDTDIYCLYTERDAYLWESDVVELFLVPDPDKPLYYEFQSAPNGALFDARFISRGGGDFRRWAQWNAPFEAAVAVNGTLNDWTDQDQGYTAEWRIPWSAFADASGTMPPKGQTWRAAAARADFSVTLEKEQRSATANLPGGDPHTGRDGYFTLRFE